MVDIETFGTDSNAVVLSISAVKFDLDTGEIGGTFELALEMKEQMAKGALMDPDTVMWWMSQSKEAQNMLSHLQTVDVDIALELFNNFCKGADGIWGNGATFDNVIIRNLYKRHDTDFKLGFWADRDVRTLVALSGIDHSTYRFVGVRHNGLDDCLHQIKYCVDAYKILKGK